MTARLDKVGQTTRQSHPRNISDWTLYFISYYLVAMEKSFSGILEVERLEVVVVLSNELMQKTMTKGRDLFPASRPRPQRGLVHHQERRDVDVEEDFFAMRATFVASLRSHNYLRYLVELVALVLAALQVALEGEELVLLHGQWLHTRLVKMMLIVRKMTEMMTAMKRDRILLMNRILCPGLNI